jgi:hypothetical protein
MAALPPKIDQRTYEEIVEQIEALAQQFTDWKPAPQGKIDAGRALIRIFGKMLKLVSDRVNQIPEKNFLAFLDLLGGKLTPPQPAKVPLTFYLAEGSPVDAVVPAYIQVSAPPTEDSDAEIVFETTRELIVTTAQLQAAFVREPSQDKYNDISDIRYSEQQDKTFFAFLGDRFIPHSLYLTCPEIFTLPDLTEFKLIITTDNASELEKLPLNWSSWDGDQWLTQTNPINDQSNITFTNLTIPSASEIQGKTAKWLQAKLTNISSDIPKISNIQGQVTVTQSNLIPEICLFNSTPLDLSKDFYPFGEQPEINDTFYIALHDKFIKPNTTITIDIKLSHIPVNINKLRITWEVGNGQVWQEISDQNDQLKWTTNPSPIQFTEQKIIQAKLEFPNQENIPSPSTVNGETRYWIRARITQGNYGTAASNRAYPIYNDLAALKNEITKGTKEISVDTVDLFNIGDKIRLLPLSEGFPEENQITLDPDTTNNKLTLKNGVLNTKLVIGTRIMRKLIMTETIPPTYDPPLIESLKLSYEFTITESAIYCADNDFRYSYPENFATKLKQNVATGDKSLILDTAQGLIVGEFLTINSETYQIESINHLKNQVTLTSTISQNYPIDTPINRYFRPFTPTIDREPTLYLGFDKSFDNKTVTLCAEVTTPLIDETLEAETLNSEPTQLTNSNHLIWEYSSPLGWQSLGVQDETEGFYQRGLIQFIAPTDFSKTETFGKQLYWLRVRRQGDNIRIKPRLRRLLTNTMWAVQATTLRNEILGSSNYDPNQTFIANNIPILTGQQLEVEEGQIPFQLELDRVKVIRDDLGEIEEVWILWQEVPDFYASSPSDRHYTLDRQTGKISFGDGQAGMIPPRGRNNIRFAVYRSGGGKQGNIPSQTISQLKTTIPYIDRVINLEPSAGGAEQETLARLKQRVPKQLRHRDRAVTLEDFSDLAYEASTEVARVKVITPDLMIASFSALDENFWLDPTKPDASFTGKLKEIKDKIQEINRRAGQVKLIILPQSNKRQPIPSLALLKLVETYIRSRCEATVDLVVTAPKWQEVSITATITPISLDNADVLKSIIKQRLEDFLHPLTGGKGDGWQFGRYPQKSDFYAIIQSIAGVDHVNSLEIESISTEERSSLRADVLISSGNHIINFTTTK